MLANASGRREQHPFFPLCKVTTTLPKERVRLWPFNFLQHGPPPRIACSQFFHQVMPLERKLAIGNSEVAGRPGATDPFGRKTVAADHCLPVNDSQIFSDKPDWKRLLLKPNKLGMVGISIRLSPENGLGKKSFPPQGNQPAGVEVLRMQAPNSHCFR